MRVLITNDDGILAPGLSVMERIAASVADEVWTVAPETDQSGIGHALTLSNPLRIREVEDRRFAVSGTPADCAIVGVRSILPEPPDLVLSGVNAGQNIADDVVYSGTIGGAMEGRLMGIPAIAVSQAYRWQESKYIPWETVERHGPELIGILATMRFDGSTFLNVNFPSVDPSEVKGVRAVRQGSVDHSLEAEERTDTRGNAYHWLRFARGEPLAQEGSDVAALRDGYITVTPLNVDLTSVHAMDAVADRLALRD